MVSVVELDDMHDNCRLFSVGKPEKGEFYSPMYPNHYGNDTDCILVIEAKFGFGIQVDFRDHFVLEPSENCEYDFLEVRDGAFGYSPLRNRYCGQQFPPKLTSEDRHLWLRFHSDDTIQYQGFRAVYEFFRNEAIDRPEIGPCHFEVSGVQGIVQTTDIPRKRLEYTVNHSVPIDCTWAITVTPKQKIYMFFEEFKLIEPNSCDANYVQIFSNGTDMSNCLELYCGAMADPITTKSHVVYFRYYALPRAVDTTFKAYFTAFRDINIEDKTSVTEVPKCYENEFDCDDATCIDISLLCNGIKNCRHEYDEENCNSSQKLKFNIQAVHIIIILTLGCALLGGMCFTMCYNCVRKLIHDGRQIHENIRRSREQLEQSRSTLSAASSPRAIRRGPHTIDDSCYLSSDAKTNGRPNCLRNESDEETDVEEEEEEEEEELEEMEGTCVEMRDCECQTRDSLMQRDSSVGVSGGAVGLPLPATPPPPPPPSRRPPGLPSSFTPGSPQVPTPPPPPVGVYGRAPSGSQSGSNKYGSSPYGGRSPHPPPHSASHAHHDPYEVGEPSDDVYGSHRFRAEAVIEMNERAHYEPAKSPKTTPDVLATH
ncbi:uncharacterized protein LOC143027627 [Oratosquilla oratoria]|uniref:uncharacterized protein LOC143027627 n=1 Tax=Oratosquilla oratoria TaxID=337810 RepID=UPI003F776204